MSSKILSFFNYPTLLANHHRLIYYIPKGETAEGAVQQISGNFGLWATKVHIIMVARDGFGLNYTQSYLLATILHPRPARSCSEITPATS